MIEVLARLCYTAHICTASPPSGEFLGWDEDRESILRVVLPKAF